MHISFSKITPFLNRIGRLPLSVFIRKYIVFFILLIIFILTNVLGLWNVKRIVIELPQNAYSDMNELEKSLSPINGRNIFSVTTDDVLNVIGEKNGFVKGIDIKKNIPSTLYVIIKEYKPMFIGYSSNKCVLFSKEGNDIKELCKDCEQECPTFLSNYSAIHIISYSSLESNGKLIFRDELTDIVDILKQFGYTIQNISIESGICTLTDSNGHSFIFDLSDELDTQLSRMYVVGKKVNKEDTDFVSIDLRFDRPIMRLK